jgi:tape measure domain-containing protein
MSGIATTIKLVDNMTAPLMSIQHAISGVQSYMAELSNSGVDISSFTAINNQLNLADAGARALGDEIQLVADNISSAEIGQYNFNAALRQGHSAAGGLLGKIGAMAAAYASIRGIKNALGLSDEMTQTTARLGLMNDGLQTTAQLQDKIFLSAQRTGALYGETANAVSRLGLLAGKAFSSNDEIIAFTEQMNKNFVIGGASVQEQTSAMYQLTQAMAAGKLQGDEYRSIIENAPLLAGAIESYMQNAGVEGTMKDWASEGLLTADVIKAALFSVADETNERFEQMPLTFGMIANQIKNNALMEFQPILNRLNEIANSPAFQTFANNVTKTITVVAAVVTVVFDMITRAAQFASDNWSWLAPIIYTVVGAMAAYVVIMGIYNTIQAISNGLQAVAAFNSSVLSAKVALLNGATFAQTVAQYGLNAALLACPLTWVVLAIVAIIAAIYLLIGWFNKVAQTSISATGVIAGAVMWLLALIGNIVIGTLNALIQYVWALFVEPFIGIIEWVLNVCNGGFDSFGDAVANLIGQIISWFLSLGKIVTKIIDAIFGTSWTAGLSALQSSVLEWGKNDTAITLSREAPAIDYRFDMTDAYNSGYSWGENLANLDLASLVGSNIPDPMDYGAYDLSEIGGGVGDIAANTSKQLDYSEEELKLWRDIAERDTINRFTTAEVSVSFGDVNNNVSSGVDLDGIVDYIAEKTEEALLVTAAGVHYDGV